MNTQILSLAVFVLLMSCEKPRMPARVSCVFTKGYDGNESSSHDLSSKDEDRYFEIWKSLVIEKSNLSKDEFENHFSDFNITSNTNNEGTSIRVDYDFKFDWIEFRTSNKFLVEYIPIDNYPQHAFPRGQLLNENWVIHLIENEIGANLNFTSVDISQKPAFRSCTQALRAARKNSGYKKLNIESIDFFVPGKMPRENGQPYAKLQGTIDKDTNRCLTGNINLITGEWNVSETVCSFN